MADKLEALARLARELWEATDLDDRIALALAGLQRAFAYEHSMLLVPSDDGAHLMMLACHGYPGGVGASVPVGKGVIGTCAERRVGIRINHVQRELDIFQRVHEPAAKHAEIPFPGIADAQSLLCVPASIEGRLCLVLYVEDAKRGRFVADDSHVLEVVANLLSGAIRDAADEGESASEGLEPEPPKAAATLSVRYYPADGSVFFNDDYVIKSLPGRILFKLLKAQKETGRREFSKKELRLDETLGLPPVRDNLDTRLILLRGRLAERFPYVQIAPVGRGRFSLTVDRPFSLVEASAKYP